MLRWFRRRTAEERATEALVDLIVASMDEDAGDWKMSSYAYGRETRHDSLDVLLRFDLWSEMTAHAAGTAVTLTTRQKRRLARAEKDLRKRRQAAAEKSAILRVRDNLHDRSKLFAPTYSG